ncbi:hypothetical protein vseg_009398 [Gypsophila vaccaria]
MGKSSEEKGSGLNENNKSEQVCSFFKKPIKNKNIRKRPVNEDGHDDDDDGDDQNTETSLLRDVKRPFKTDNKLYFSTGMTKKSVSESAEEPRDAIFHYESSKMVQVQTDNKATATLETETDFSRDARAIRERALKQAQEALKGKNKASGGDEKLYKGMNNYTDHRAGFRREQTVAAEKAGGAHGPLRASAHIKVSTRFDYQPDICKDYKETGYCGYGDSCKFMHDRGDYKSGWQLEKEWDEREKVRKRNLAMGVHDDEDDEDADEEDDDALPFACFICRQPFVDAVVTNCKHYFCEHCALKHHSKNKKCFVCDQPTGGIFNTATEIRKRTAAEKKLKG